MSGQALGWVRKHRGHPSREAKSCAMFLADNADDQMAWPSKGTLAEDMMCSEKTVMRLLADLVEAGVLIRLDVEDQATGRTRTCGYYFPIQGHPPSADEVKRFERKIGGRVTRVSPWEGDTGGAQEGDTGVTGRGTTVSPLYEPPLEPGSSDELPPGGRAREALGSERGVSVEVLAEIEAAIPRRMLLVSDQREYLAELDALAVEGVDLAVVPGCLRRWGENPLFVSRKVPIPLEKWLRSGMWRGSLPEPEAAPAEAEAGPDWAAEPGAIAVWIAVMAEMQVVLGATSFGSYLGPAALGQIGAGEGGQLFVVMRNGVARDWLADVSAGRWATLKAAWAKRDGRELTLISKSDFEARLRQGSEGS